MTTLTERLRSRHQEPALTDPRLFASLDATCERVTSGTRITATYRHTPTGATLEVVTLIQPELGKRLALHWTWLDADEQCCKPPDDGPPVVRWELDELGRWDLAWVAWARPVAGCAVELASIEWLNGQLVKLAVWAATARLAMTVPGCAIERGEAGRDGIPPLWWMRVVDCDLLQETAILAS